MVVIIAGVALWNYHEQPQFCAICHIMQPYLESWGSPPLLAYAHAEENITCLECHEPTIQQQMEEGIKFVTKDYENPLQERKFDQEWCLRCHEHGSYEELTQRTEELELNPHDSHYGEMECSICHKVHRASEDYCAQCHDPVATGTGWITATQPITQVLEWWDPDMDCAYCHVSYTESMQGATLLAYGHAQEELVCLDCHELAELEQVHEEAKADITEVKQLEVSNELCFGCHVTTEHTSYEAIIELTKDYTINPHDSHYGEMECSICHKVHKASEDFCAQCHDPVATAMGWITATQVLEWWEPDMDCAYCHVMASYTDSLQDATLLAYTHAQEGLVCLDCHEQAVLEQVHEEAKSGAPRLKGRRFSKEFCFDCHVPNEHTSYEEVIERTKDYSIDDEKINPHDPHAGVEGSEQEQFECYGCHKMHKESPGINYCYGCHMSGTFESCSVCH
jgi:cytochrome c nitrite reductase small subunit